MAVQTPPYVLQGGSHPASTFRQIQQGQMGSPFGSFAGGIGSTAAGGGHGVCGATDLVVSQNGTPNMSVNVAGGLAFIRGTESASQGVYGGYNDAVVNLAVSSSDPTNPRIDLVVLKVRDSFYSGVSADLSLVVVTGTPAAVPVAPAVPNNALVLYQIAVAAASATVLNAALTDVRTWAAALGGVVPCTSTTRPSGASLFPGLMIYERDTFRFMQYQSVTTGWTPPWNMPWGQVAFVEPGSANQASITGAAVDLTNMTVTFVAVTNRLYKITAWGHFISTVAGDNAVLALFANGSSVAAGYVTCNASEVVSLTVVKRVTLPAGARVVKLQGSRSTGTGSLTFYTARNASITVEDIGPSANPT